MFGRNKNSHTNQRLDQLGRALVRAAAQNPENEAKAEAVATAPFLYARPLARCAVNGAGRRLRLLPLLVNQFGDTKRAGF